MLGFHKTPFGQPVAVLDDVALVSKAVPQRLLDRKASSGNEQGHTVNIISSTVQFKVLSEKWTLKTLYVT